METGTGLIPGISQLKLTDQDLGSSGQDQVFLIELEFIS
jgi:hypothetical protein